jgi:hypothetical protein
MLPLEVLSVLSHEHVTSYEQVGIAFFGVQIGTLYEQLWSISV